MSSILDALRKLDEQKSARKQQTVDVAQAVVKKPAKTQGIRVNMWQLVAAFVLVTVLTIVGTFFSIRPAGKSVQTAVVVDAPFKNTSVNPKVQVLPAIPQTTAPSPAPLAVPLILNKQQSHLPLITAPIKQQVRIPEIQPVTTQPLADAPAVQPLIPQPAPPEQRHPVYAQAHSLKITGIGWQKDPAGRYAVINGTAVSEGETIDGAKVDEILPEKVRLKIDGKAIELTLGK